MALIPAQENYPQSCSTISKRKLSESMLQYSGILDDDNEAQVDGQNDLMQVEPPVTSQHCISASLMLELSDIQKRKREVCDAFQLKYFGTLRQKFMQWRKSVRLMKIKESHNKKLKVKNDMLKMIMDSKCNQALYSAFRIWKYHNQGSPSPIRKQVRVRLSTQLKNSSSGVKNYANDDDENVALRNKIE